MFRIRSVDWQEAGDSSNPLGCLRPLRARSANRFHTQYSNDWSWDGGSVRRLLLSILDSSDDRSDHWLSQRVPIKREPAGHTFRVQWDADPSNAWREGSWADVYGHVHHPHSFHRRANVGPYPGIFGNENHRTRRQAGNDRISRPPGHYSRTDSSGLLDWGRELYWHRG